MVFSGRPAKAFVFETSLTSSGRSISRKLRFLEQLLHYANWFLTETQQLNGYSKFGLSQLRRFHRFARRILSDHEEAGTELCPLLFFDILLQEAADIIVSLAAADRFPHGVPTSIWIHYVDLDIPLSDL